ALRAGISLPLPVLFPEFANPDLHAALFLALAALQTLALVALYARPISKTLLATGSLLLLAISLGAPVLTSFDLYGYAQDALLGRASYGLTHAPFAGDFAILGVGAWFGRTAPTMYGPLWFPIVQLVTGIAPTLFGKILALRVFGAASFAALVILLRSAGQPPRVVAAVALNPALSFLLIANGHNDAIPIAILVAAAALVRRYPVPALSLVAIAGLVKLPYAVLGLPVASAIRSSSARTAACAGILGVTIAFSLLGSGTAYARDLLVHSGPFDLAEIVRACVAVLALVTIGIAIFRGRRFRSALWLMPALGAFRLPWIFPWYALFGFPYALARHNVMRYLLVSLPLVSAIITPELARVWTFLIAIPLATALSVIA
ncbi:MAG TPA: hypothetical protein VKR05_04320, partial [Candidatus Cybelea sp.]|nr:hypothetical protein [Candidatus Cybelea sp.]